MNDVSAIFRIKSNIRALESDEAMDNLSDKGEVVRGKTAEISSKAEIAKGKLGSIRVDYHFHPNLPKNRDKAIKAAKRWWKIYKKNKINVVIITEHVYKDPKRAYEIMLETKPDDMLCFPGLEYLTKEGIDLIMFSKSRSIYSYKKLAPYALSYEEAISFVEQHDDVESFVTHPYVVSKTGIIKTLGYEKFQHYVKRLGSIELVSIGGMQRVVKLLKKMDKVKFSPINKAVNAQMHKMKRSMVVPDLDFELHDLKFIAIGSDAHHFSEVGNCLELKTASQKRDAVFHEITHSKQGEIHLSYHGHLEKRPHLGVIRSGITVFHEYLLKQPHRLKKNKNHKKEN